MSPGVGVGIALMPLLIGLIFVGVGIGMLRTQRRNRSRWVPTTGTVTRWDHTPISSMDIDTVSLPVVDFVTHDGRPIQASPSSAVDVGIYRTGHTVDIWYDPANPQRIAVGSTSSTLLPILLIVIGVVPLGIGLVLGAVVLPKVF